MGDNPLMLQNLPAGDVESAERWLTVVYEDLRRLAAFKLSQEAPGHTLQPTALVHEAWVRLNGSRNLQFENRTHFFSVAAEAMRRILIDRARRKQAVRHGGEFSRVDSDGLDLPAPAADEQMIAVNDALDRFAVEYPLQAEVVKLRYFVGLTNEEIGQLLGVSVSTVKNYWVFARAWLFREINGK